MIGADGSKSRPAYIVLIILVSVVVGAAGGWIAHPDAKTSRIVGTVEGISRGGSVCIGEPETEEDEQICALASLGPEADLPTVGMEVVATIVRLEDPPESGITEVRLIQWQEGR